MTEADGPSVATVGVGAEDRGQRRTEALGVARRLLEGRRSAGDRQTGQPGPRLAGAEILNAVAVTEPDYGSDVAGVKVTATPPDGGWLIERLAP